MKYKKHFIVYNEDNETYCEFAADTMQDAVDEYLNSFCEAGRTELFKIKVFEVNKSKTKTLECEVKPVFQSKFKAIKG